MSGANNVRAGGAYVEIGGDDKALAAALNRAGAKMRGLGSVVTGMGTRLAAAGALIVAPLTAAAVMSAKSGAALYDMSQRTGISASNLSSLGFAASMVGAEMEVLEGSIRKMQKAIVQAAGGSKQANEALERVHLTVEDLKGISPDEQFRKIAAGLASIHDPTVRAATAMQLFGKSGTQILPMVDQLAEFETYAKRMGLVRTDESARSAKELAVAFMLAERAGKAVWGTLASAVMPVIKEQTAVVLRATLAVRNWIKDHKDLVATAFKVGTALIVAGTAAAILGRTIGFAGTVLGGFGSALGMVRSLIAGSISFVFAMVTALGSLPIILAAVAGYFLYTSGVGKAALSALGSYFGDLKDTAMETFGGVRDALAAGDWKLAAEVAWAGLKVAWAQGIQPLQTMWAGLKAFAMETWANIGDKLVEYTYRAIGALKGAWEKFKAWYKNMIADVGDGAVKLYIDAQEAMGAISSAEADAQRRNLTQINQVSHAQTDAERDAALQANDAETQARLEAIKQIHDAEIARINAKSAEEIAATQADLDQKRAALDALARKAKGEAQAKKKDRFGDLPTLPNAPGLPGEDELGGIMKSVKAVGTFSARGASGLGSADLGKQQLASAKAAEKWLALCAKALDDLKRRGPLTF